MPTPYADALSGQDPVAVLKSSFDDYRRLVAGMTPAKWETPYAPGKWTAHEVMLHVAQWEMIFGVRLRCALAIDGYVIQSLTQDPLMDLEGNAVDAPTAVALFEGVRRANIALTSSLTPAQRAQKARHAERGPIDVEDLLITLAGHGTHHLKQLEQVRGM